MHRIAPAPGSTPTTTRRGFLGAVALATPLGAVALAASPGPRPWFDPDPGPEHRVEAVRLDLGTPPARGKPTPAELAAWAELVNRTNARPFAQGPMVHAPGSLIYRGFLAHVAPVAATSGEIAWTVRHTFAPVAPARWAIVYAATGWHPGRRPGEFRRALDAFDGAHPPADFAALEGSGTVVEVEGWPVPWVPAPRAGWIPCT